MPTRLRQLYERTPSSSSSIAAAGALTRYVLDVVPSATGGLSSASEQAVTVTFPTGTTFTRWDGGDLFDRELNATVGNCSAPDANRRSFCSLFGNVIIAPGDHLRITFYGVDNPSTAGARSVDVATTSDTVAAASPSYDIAPRGAIDNLAVTAGDLTPGAVTNYVVTFAASATGGLSRPPDASAITLTLPPGTGIPAFPTTSVVDVEQARTVVGGEGGDQRAVGGVHRGEQLRLGVDQDDRVDRAERFRVVQRGGRRRVEEGDRLRRRREVSWPGRKRPSVERAPVERHGAAVDGLGDLVGQFLGLGRVDQRAEVQRRAAGRRGSRRRAGGRRGSCGPPGGRPPGSRRTARAGRRSAGTPCSAACRSRRAWG